MSAVGESDGAGSEERTADLVLARVHLRLGSVELARAELETLAGHDALDLDGLVDLAEARWRTGDIDGAGEAAMAALDDDDGPLLALVVAAEAAAARGRPTEARRYVDRAMLAADGSIDRLFAGMPRGSAWPPDPAAPPPAPTTMFDPPHGPARSTSPPPRRPPDIAPAAPAPSIEAETVDRSETATIGMWDEATAGADAVEPSTELDAEAAAEAERAAEVDAQLETDARVTSGLPTAADELARGAAALGAEDVAAAAISLGLVLRLGPDLAPAVIDLVEGRTEPGLAFVRGDAYRLVGRELDALDAYASAMRPAAAPESDLDQHLDEDPRQGDPA